MYWMIVIGILSLTYGGYRKVQENSLLGIKSIQRYEEQIKEQNLEFVQQFELSQQQLENLYAPTLTQIENQITQLTEVVNRLALCQSEFEWSQKTHSTTMNESTQKMTKEIWKLEQQGVSVEEMSRLLNRSVGEVMLLRNMLKK